MNKFTVYILQSEKNNRYYIGQTDNLENRLRRHNSGGVRSTKYGIPWVIVCFEEYKDRVGSMRREKEIKQYKGGIKFKKLLGLWLD